MKYYNNKVIIGIDHGYGNIKTANHIFRTGIISHDSEPPFTRNMLVYDGKYYTIGEGHKEFKADKQKDDEYYVLTLAAVAMELRDRRLTEADVFIAAGLPLTWVAEQKSEFAAYLTRNKEVSFIITFAKTVTNVNVTVGTPGEELCRIYADGKDAYCIEPGYSLYSGNTLTEGKSSAWNGIPAATRKAVNIALLYGKPGNSKNLGYTDGQQWIATQLIVWELISGCRNTNEGFKCTNTKYIDGMCAGGKNPGVKDVYNKISTAMSAHSTVPSFAAVLASKAPTHTMQYKDGKYQITKTA